MAEGDSQNNPAEPARKPSAARGWFWRWRRRRRFPRTVSSVVESLFRTVAILAPPLQLKRARPGATPGIEHAELAAMPSAPGPVYVTCIDYSPDHVLVQEITDIDEFLARHRPEWSVVRWINVDGLSDLRVIRGLAEKYRLHPLAIEDLLQIPQRPKVDPYLETGEFQARLFIIVRMIQLRPRSGTGPGAVNTAGLSAASPQLRSDRETQDQELHSEQVAIFLGHKTVLTFQETHGDVWDPIRQRIRTKGSRLRSNDASFLVYSLLDALVDHCFPILEHYGNRLHELEEHVLERPDASTLNEIHAMNRQLMLLRQQIWPMRDVILALQRESHECLSEATRTYLRDVYDHIIQIIDILEIYRETAASIAETYATSLGNRLNEVMKVLTIVTTIFVPLTFLAGVYGMNFPYMPEIHGGYHYPWVYPLGFWGLCVGIAGGLLWAFRRRGWL